MEGGETEWTRGEKNVERERESDGQYGKEEEKNGFETKGRQFKLVEC